MMPASRCRLATVVTSLSAPSCFVSAVAAAALPTSDTSAPFSNVSVPLSPSASWVPCWERGHERELCCRGGALACFDSIFTRRECCDAGGFARLYPVADADEPSWGVAEHWLNVADMLAHPSFSMEQRAWESEMQNASVMLSEDIMGHQLRMWVFKRSVLDFAESLRELQEDEYGLFRLTQPQASKGEASRGHSVAIDAGASVGMFAILLAKLWIHIRIIAIEAAPANYRYLLWNLRVNGVANRVWPLNVALGAEASAGRVFHYSPTYPRTSQVCQGEGCANVNEPDEKWRGGWIDWQVRFQVPQLTLAEIIAVFDVPGKVHLLKVDCEGCEWGVFAPSSWPRISHRVRYVTAELHRWALDGLLDSSGAEATGVAAEQARRLEEFVRDNICQRRLMNGPDFYVCSNV
eukprot:TRINITY_DN65515_c0_g1_i1.p1 TRINITY_DN65515_c0_g1~~TRINITY_DN65515_c0_g1_i1.p1  ORF type:complete len:407 (-),score=72.01 TRINITY_DN65515_c0_g1_i1:35-1255(-)